MSGEIQSSINFAAVAEADPACLDDKFRDGVVAQMNISKDARGLLKLAETSVATLVGKEADLTVEEKWAVIRDCGILIGSLIRNGVNPIVEVNGLGRLSSNIGNETRMPPYHTVFHYTTVNPRGERERSFTGSGQEKIFIEQVRIGTDSFMESANQLFPVFTGDVGLETQEAIDRIAMASISLNIGIATVPRVMKEVGAEYFARVMRPFFNQMEIGGEVYDAPGGAQMPLLAVDHVLWASDTAESDYVLFREKNLKYLPPFIRENILKTLGWPSIKSKVDSGGLMNNPVGKSLDQIITRLLSFRKAHEKLARDSFAYRSSDALGSGGATPDLLQDLSRITRIQKGEL